MRLRSLSECGGRNHKGVLCGNTLSGKYTRALFDNLSPGYRHEEHPNFPLNCLQQRTAAFAGRSKIPITSLARIVVLPIDVFITVPRVESSCKVFGNWLEQQIHKWFTPTNPDTTQDDVFGIHSDLGWKI